MKAPCKNCADRKLHCHSTCEKYLEFANAKEEEREKQHKEKLKRLIISVYRLNAERKEEGDVK